MSDVALVSVTGYDQCAITDLVDSILDKAVSEGHMVEHVNTVYDKACKCGGHCCSAGGEGCGDEDCLCSFAPKVAESDVLVFVLPFGCDVSPKQADRIISKVVSKSIRYPSRPKKVFLVACSDIMEESVFEPVVLMVDMACTKLDTWSFAGKVLLPGLPEACFEADPRSCRQASSIVEMF